MSDLIDDPALLRAFKAGETAALDRAFRMYLPLVAAIVRQGFAFDSEGRSVRFRGTRSEFEADDLIADVFARAFRPQAREAYDGLRPYANYLKTIARNTIVEHLRRHNPLDPARCVTLDEAAVEDTAADAEASPLELLARSELLGLARAFVATLSERDRTVVSYRFVEDRTQAELGAALGHSLPTVRKLERGVVRAFHRFLRAKGYLTEDDPAPHDMLLLAVLVLAELTQHGM